MLPPYLSMKIILLFFVTAECECCWSCCYTISDTSWTLQWENNWFSKESNSGTNNKSNNVLIFLYFFLQALIEVCAGNFTNQEVAFKGQIVDSINIILRCTTTSHSSLEVSIAFTYSRDNYYFFPFSLFDLSSLPPVILLPFLVSSSLSPTPSLPASSFLPILMIYRQLN